MKIIGIEITLGDRSIMILQWRYLKSILKKEGLDKANPVGMLLDPNVALEPNLDGNIGNRRNSYTQLIGELQFIANTTRPDITYAISKLSAYTANPTMQHVTALKQVLQYLSGTKSFGITYGDIQYLITLTTSLVMQTPLLPTWTSTNLPPDTSS